MIPAGATGAGFVPWLTAMSQADSSGKGTPADESGRNEGAARAVKVCDNNGSCHFEIR